MDVSKLDKITPALGAKDRRKRRYPDELEQPEPGGHGHEHDHEHGHRKGSEHDVQDRISVMGIPADEMTPAVERAITLLLEEIHHLREQLTQSKGHEAYLERHADEHPFLPVINRRALVARLNQMLMRARESNVTSAFIYLHVGNAERIRTRYGHDAEEGLLRLVADTLRADFGTDALIGSMDSADFGIILPVAEEDEARQRMLETATALRSASFAWNDVDLAPDVVAGLHIFRGSDNAEDILSAADEDLILQGKATAD